MVEKGTLRYAVGFVRLILIYSLLDSISGPLWMTVQATGRIKKYQIAISFIILSNLLISYLFLKQGYNPYIVLWIRIFFKHHFFNLPHYLSKKNNFLSCNEICPKSYIKYSSSSINLYCIAYYN
jgi:hypothetical protein